MTLPIDEGPDDSPFKKASSLIPMEQVKELYDNLKCGNHVRKGCKIQKDWPNLYYCRVCMMLQATGEAFFSDESKLTDNMLYNMTDWQHKQYNDALEYWTAWRKNYPKGASNTPEFMKPIGQGSDVDRLYRRG